MSKPFDLNKALAGEKVVDEYGNEVSQITVFDVTANSLPLVAVKKGAFHFYKIDGSLDGIQYLHMATKVKTLYIAVRNTTIKEDEFIYATTHAYPNEIGAKHATGNSMEYSIHKITIEE